VRKISDSGVYSHPNNSCKILKRPLALLRSLAGLLTQREDNKNARRPVHRSTRSHRESIYRAVGGDRYVLILLASYVLMAADRYLFPVLAPDVRRAFHFSLADTGLLSTIFTLGLGIGGLPTGFLLSHFSRKTVMLLGISIFSAALP